MRDLCAPALRSIKYQDTKLVAADTLGHENEDVCLCLCACVYLCLCVGCVWGVGVGGGVPGSRPRNSHQQQMVLRSKQPLGTCLTFCIAGFLLVDRGLIHRLPGISSC
jgi:hypothetical protein